MEILGPPPFCRNSFETFAIFCASPVPRWAKRGRFAYTAPARGSLTNRES